MKSAFLRYAVVSATVSALLLGTGGLLSWRVNAAEGATHVPVPVSINALMVAVVDHSAHEIWDAGNEAGTLTGREWQEAEQHAIQLAGSGSLISLGGTGTADAGWVASPAWQDWSQQLTDGAVAALEAIRGQDQMALLDAGGAIVETCEGCHQVFKPDAPTEGLLHIPHYDN